MNKSNGCSPIGIAAINNQDKNKQTLIIQDMYNNQQQQQHIIHIEDESEDLLTDSDMPGLIIDSSDEKFSISELEQYEWFIDIDHDIGTLAEEKDEEYTVNFIMNNKPCTIEDIYDIKHPNFK